MKDYSRYTSMRCNINQLDPISLQYLQSVDAASGSGYHGIYIRRSSPWISGPRSGWFMLVFLGLLALGPVAILTLPSITEKANFRVITLVQTGLVFLGVFFIVTGVARFLRPKPTHQIRSFLFADALHLWDVNPHRVEATELAGLGPLDGKHQYTNGAYTYSHLVFRSPGATLTYIVHDRTGVERLAGFLGFLGAVRNSTDESIRLMALQFPGRFGAMAYQVAVYGQPGPLESIPDCPEPPRPGQVPGEPLAARPGWGGTFARAAVAGAVGLAAFFALPLLDRYLLDDHLFIKAEREATQQHSPAGLLNYLAEPANTRHREAARQMVAGYYDRAIVDLKQRAEQHLREQAGPQQKVDRQLLDAIFALLEGLKQADFPAVTVGFKATQDSEPTNEVHKLAERLEYDNLIKDHRVKAVADRQPDKSAILSRGKVFDADQTANRQQVILTRLREAIRKGLKGDILTLQEAKSGEEPLIEVAYHVFAPGRLYLYTDRPAAPNPFGGFRPGNQDVIVKGLLRGFDIDWTITIRPPGADKSYVCKLGSQPAQNLNYDGQPGDPDWAPYAIILYSGFYDMSARLISNFGLDPGTAPNSFSFTAVARTGPDPGPPPQPNWPIPGKKW
jgi:hypothetical protein